MSSHKKDNKNFKKKSQAQCDDHQYICISTFNNIHVRAATKGVLATENIFAFAQIDVFGQISL